MQKLTELDVFLLNIQQAYNLISNYNQFSNIGYLDLAKSMMGITKTENASYIVDLQPNSVGATGLNQVKPVAKEQVEKNVLGIAETDDSSLLDANYNAFIATAYLAYQYNRYSQDWQAAIFAYNQGHYDSNSSDGQSYYNIWLKNYNSFDFNQMVSDIENQFGSIAGDVLTAVENPTSFFGILLIIGIAGLVLWGIIKIYGGK